MKAEFIGAPAGSDYYQDWSDPANWAGGTVPDSSRGLNIKVDASQSPGTSFENLGTPGRAFLANDVVGAGDISAGISSPSLSVFGFLDANNLGNFSEVDLVFHFGTQPLSTLVVRHDMSNVGSATIERGGLLEIGNHFGNTAFNLRGDAGSDPSTRGTTLILDRPPACSLDNSIFLGISSVAGGTDRIELGGLTFDMADLIPNPSGTGSSNILLTEHGRPVYELTNVTESPFTPGTLSVGVDHQTGYDFVSYHT